MGSERVSMERLGEATEKAKPRRVAASEWSRGDASDIDGKTDRSIWAGAHESVSMARVDGNAARVAGASTGQCERSRQSRDGSSEQERYGLTRISNIKWRGYDPISPIRADSGCQPVKIC